MTNPNTMKTRGIFIFGVLVLIGLVWIGNRNTTEVKKEWKANSCPSLLSIARSSRDTLIVMKYEPLCNEYLMDNLK